MHRTGLRFVARLAVLLWLGLPVLAAEAGAPLSVRLVEAANDREEVSPALRDVVPMLRSNLPFRRFTLLDQATVKLPSTGQQAGLAGGFLLNVQGSQDRLSVTLERHGKVLIQTVLSLQNGKPFVLGGFPQGAGKLLLVLVVR